MASKPAISACLAVENEADTIGEALRSVAFCDEVVVVDGGSTDGTAAIAHRLGAKVLVHPSGDGGIHANKNRAIAAARGPWILSLDADERVPEALAEEIRRAVAAPGAPDAFFVPRKTYWGDRWVRSCGWWPAETVRLFRKGATEWPLEVHGVPPAPPRTGRLATPLEHRSIRDWDDWLRKVRHFSACEAVEMHRAGRRVRFVRDLVFAPPAVFLRKYFLQGGLRDGTTGFFVSASAAMAVFLKYARLYGIESGAPHPRLGGREGRSGRVP